MKLLLINPSRRHLGERDFWDADFLRRTLGLYNSIPLWALTLAALTPQDVEVKIVDENIEDVNFDEDTDLIGIGGMTVFINRVYKIAEEFRKRGKKVVIGGIHASMLPEEAIGHADSVVIGEAEDIWKEVIDDFKAGAHKKFYKSSGYPSLENSPVPRFDLLKSDKYLGNMIQIARGCPFDCEFCSVKDFLGPSVRCKKIEQVIREIEACPKEFLLQLFGHKIRISKPIFITDDNIGGSFSFAKTLFSALKPMKLQWLDCQASINIGKDEDLLTLMKDAGCRNIFIGFESLEEKSLKEMGKRINKVEEYEKCIETIQSYGISVIGSFVLGSDGEREGIFQKTADFIKRNNILSAMINILTPMPGTRFFRKLEAEGRILHRDWVKYDAKSVCFKLNGMPEATLEEGCRWIYQNIYSFDAMLERLKESWKRETLDTRPLEGDFGKMSVLDKIVFGIFILKLFFMTSRRLDGFVFNLKTWKEVLRGKGELGSIFQAFMLNDFASSLPKTRVDFGNLQSISKTDQ